MFGCGKRASLKGGASSRKTSDSESFDEGELKGDFATDKKSSSPNSSMASSSNSVAMSKEDNEVARGSNQRRSSRTFTKVKYSELDDDDEDDEDEYVNDSGDEVEPHAMKKRKTAPKKKKAVPSNDKENVHPQKTLAFSTALIKPDAHVYGSRSYQIDENGEKRTCDIVGCCHRVFRTFWHEDEENNATTAVFVCDAHFSAFYGSLSPEKKKETDQLIKTMFSNLISEMRSSSWKGKRVTDQVQRVCMNPKCGFALIIPPNRGGGLLCRDFPALTRIIGTKAKTGKSAEKVLYNILTTMFGFKPHPSMTYPKKAGAKYAPRLLPGALDKTVILYHPDFTSTSVPGMSRDYLDKYNKGRKAKRKSKSNAKHRSKSNEEEGDSDSDDEEN